MSTVKIPESGLYDDRRDRRWVLMDQNTWLRIGGGAGPVHATNAQIQLLIERDQHRDECGGGRLADCIKHPVPSVTLSMRGKWGAYGALCYLPSSRHDILTEAMDAARALAVTP